MSDKVFEIRNAPFAGDSLGDAVEVLPQQHHYTPASPMTEATHKIFTAGGDIDALGATSLASKSQTITVKASDRARQITFETAKSTTIVEISDITALAGSNKSVKKIFTLALEKALAQAFFDGELTKDVVSFPISEMVDRGIYGSRKAAKTGFDAAAKSLKSLSIGGTYKGKSEEDTFAVASIFPTIWRDNTGTAFFRLNKDVSWGTILKFYMLLPDYYYRLPNKAADLLYYIFYLARQNASKIEKTGCFTISYRAIVNRLGLKDPDSYTGKNFKQDIFQPIEDAITTIETENNNRDLTITPRYKGDTPIEEVRLPELIRNGFLEISLTGKYAKEFIALSKDTRRKQLEAAKKRQRVLEQAQVKALTTKITAQEKEGQ